MNIYLLEHLLRWIGMLFVSFISIFNVGTYEEYVLNVDNKNMSFGTSIVNHQPIVLQNSKVEEVQEEIQTPVVNETQQIKEEKPIIKEEITKDIPEQVETTNLEVMTAKVTGYGSDCQGCSGTGNLACRTKSGSKHSLIINGIYYNDDTYGNVRIVAAAKQKFPCGTVIEISKAGQQSILAIVMDRGASMNNAYSNGIIWIDLAYATIADAKQGGVSGLDYQVNVKRWGW